MRSIVVVGRSIWDRPSPLFSTKSGARDYTRHRAADRLHFRTIQRVSDPAPGILASDLDIVASRTANKSEVKEMGHQNGANMIFKKLFSLFVTATLLIPICASPAISASSSDHPGEPAQKRPAAQALPAPGTYQIDPDHTFAYFGARHHVVGLVRGRFDKVTGTFTVSRNVADCSVDITIETSSISTQNIERDEDLGSPFYFDVKKFPTMTYRGRGIRPVSADSWTMDGSLTIHGVTKVGPLTFAFNGPFPDIKPGKPVRVAFHGSAGTKRADFGLGARDNLKELGTSTAPDVQIEIDVEADAKPATP